MNTKLHPLLLALALAGSGGLTAGRVTAQTFQTLYSFSVAQLAYTGENSQQYFTNCDGGNPVAGLTLANGTLYGTANQGGPNGTGTVFSLSTNGLGFSTLHGFAAALQSGYQQPHNSDGMNPTAPLIVAGNLLYGTALQGGPNGNGTVFSLGTNGAGFTNVYVFTAHPYSSAVNGDGAYPQGGLILAGNTLYGTAEMGGAEGEGTVFAVNTNGTGFALVYPFTDSNGWEPDGLILAGNTLYGTAVRGGTNMAGSVFALNLNGTDFVNLHNFMPVNLNASNYSTNSDGYNPNPGLILSGNTLYGTTSAGGTNGFGTVFAVNTDGTGFTLLHTFTPLNWQNNFGYTNRDGANPVAGLVLGGNTLYGTAQSGGLNANGTVFAVNTDGTGFTSLYTFTATDLQTGTNSDGALPGAGLILSGNTLYGTTAWGGNSGWGTVFALSLPTLPSLNIASGDGQSFLFWPASATNVVLQCTTNLSAPNWVTVSNGTPLTGVALPNSVPGAFFRLAQP